MKKLFYLGAGLGFVVATFIAFKIRPALVQSLQPRPQELPIAATVKIQGQVFALEVATTPEQIAKGLMFRDSLPDRRGMLFVFDPPQSVTFWMKNTLIPLDMIFLRDGEVKYIVQNVPPCKTQDCISYGPSRVILIDQVIELNAGFSSGLRVGDRLPVTSDR